MKHRLQGLYVITAALPAQSGLLPRQVEEAINGGARIVQYRDKSHDRARRREESSALLAICRSHGALLIINDDIELAGDIGADGVHLGRDDPAIEQARQRLGPDAIIGISCYNDLQRAHQAQAAGADYVAFGRFFPSSTKPQAVQAGIDLLHRAKTELRIPLVAIGGITPENGAELIEAGADMLAVIQGVFGQPDIRRAAQEFQKLFEETET